MFPFKNSGNRIAKLRQQRGWLRADLAKLVRVDVSSVAGWESGKHQPREQQRIRLATLFQVDPAYLFSPEPLAIDSRVSAVEFDMATQAPKLLLDLTAKAQNRMRGSRLTERCETPSRQYVEWRELVRERLQAKTLTVERIEIVTGLQRLREILFNILHYTGLPYHVRAHYLDSNAPFAGFSGYAFDDYVLLLSTNWSNQIPGQDDGLRLEGLTFQRLFHSYWSEIWRRGIALNPLGAQDLSQVQVLAMKLGLPKRKWRHVVEEARGLSLADGAPPLP